MKTLEGKVTAKGTAGGVVETDGGIYYISNFDPLVGKLAVGTKISFTPSSCPGSGRNLAIDVVRL